MNEFTLDKALIGKCSQCGGIVYFHWMGEQRPSIAVCEQCGAHVNGSDGKFLPIINLPIVETTPIKKDLSRK